MKIAIIDKKDIMLKIENSAIKVDSQTIPFKIIDMLLLNHKTTIQSSDILKLNKNNISILVISHNNQNSSIITSANAKNADIKESQYLALKNRLKYAKYIITNKITSHQKQLEYIGEKISTKETIRKIKSAENIDELLGIEGSFAREYFKHFFSYIPSNIHKSKRSKQPPLDPVNALMSFWYSLYYNIITIKLLSYGFDPSIGYIHKAFRSHNALSSDILENFRAGINQGVISIFKNKVLNIDDFSKENGVYLKWDGRKKVWGEFISLVNAFKPRLDDEISYLKKFINEEI